MASTSLAVHEGAAPREEREGRKGGDAADAAAPQPQEFARRGVVQGHAAPHPLQVQYWRTASFRQSFALEFKDYKLDWTDDGSVVHMQRDKPCGELCYEVSNTYEGDFCACCCSAEWEDKLKVRFFRDGTALLAEESRHGAEEVNRITSQLFSFMKKWNEERNLGSSLAVPVAAALEQHRKW
jgi:hypothetical protein